MKRGFLLVFFLLFASSCGSDLLDDFDPTVPTQMTPYISYIDPANGSVGDTVEIHGFGFSTEAASNVVVFGNVSAFAASYELVAAGISDDIEAITVTIPPGAAVGINDVSVTVFDNTSNANITFTVDP